MSSVQPSALILNIEFMHGGPRASNISGMRKKSASSYFCPNPDCFHEFLRHGCNPLCSFGVACDAVGALRHMSDRQVDELRGFAGKRAVREPRSAEYLKRRLGVRIEATAFFNEFARGLWID